MKNWLKVRFITGFFVTVPAIATSWLLYVFWDSIDSFFSPGYERIFGRRIPQDEIIAKIDAVDDGAIRRVGRRLLAGGAPTLTALGPLAHLPDLDSVRRRLH